MEVVPAMQAVRMFRGIPAAWSREFAGQALMFMLAIGRHMTEEVEDAWK